MKNDCRNAKSHIEMTFSLSSTSCLLKFPTEKVHGNVGYIFLKLNSAIIVIKKIEERRKQKLLLPERKTQKGPDEHQNVPRHCLHLSARKKMQGENVIAVITTNRNRLKKNLMTQNTKVLPFKRFKRQGILSLKNG